MIDVLPTGPGLAGLALAAHRPGSGRVGNGGLEPPPRGPAHRRVGSPFRPGCAGRFQLAVHYIQRLAEAGAVASVGTTGDSHDNALAEVFHSLFKAELVRNRDLWRELEEVEIAVAEYVDWFNHRRLHFQIGRWSRLGVRRGLLSAEARLDRRRYVASEPPINPERDTRRTGPRHDPLHPGHPPDGVP